MLDEMQSLPLRQRIGQLFTIGIPGPSFDEPARELFAEISPAGVCLFARNIRERVQTHALLGALRDNCSVVPFLSIDQEGGTVDRLRRVLEPMPAAGSLQDPEQAVTLARITAEALRILGFNLNYAPVVDVISDDRGRFSNGLHTRTFGNSAETATKMAEAYLGTLRSGGVLGSLKHFPGLGASDIDSHENLPEMRISEAVHDAVDLFPYRRLLSRSIVDSVMIAHAAYPELGFQERDSSGRFLPSSLSRNVVGGLLREKLNFAGLILTDDLEMGAIVRNYGIGEASVMAVEAGCDQLLICNDPRAIRDGFSAVLAAVESGRISESRINESLQRIAVAKNLIEPPLPFDESRLDALSAEIVRLKASLN